MLRSSLVGSALLLSLVGCAATAETASTSEDALEETPTEPAVDPAVEPGVSAAPRVTADELATQAETHFNEVEASDPGFSQAPSTVFFALDDEAPVLAEGDEQLDVEVADEDIDAANVHFHNIKVTSKTSPVFYFQSSSKTPFAVGTSACKDVGGAIVVVKDQVRFKPTVDSPCSITITKIYFEDFGVGNDAVAAQAVGLRPRRIIVGTVSGTLQNEAGTLMDVRGGFVLPQFQGF